MTKYRPRIIALKYAASHMCNCLLFSSTCVNACCQAFETIQQLRQSIEDLRISHEREISDLRRQLQEESSLRRATESRLSRLLYGSFDVGASFHKSMMHLLLCCDESVPNCGVDEAIFGFPGSYGVNCLVSCMITDHCDVNYIRTQVSNHRLELQSLAYTRRLLNRATAGSYPGALVLDHLLAIRLYTFGNDRLQFYSAINNPFYDPTRKKGNLVNQLPFVRLLIRSLRALGRHTKFETNVTVYRGASIQNSPYLQQVYNDFVQRTPNNHLVVGSLLRFPAFTSTSRTLETAMSEFGADFVYIVTLKHEVIHSYYEFTRSD
jgi:hypothetical protein